MNTKKTDSFSLQTPFDYEAFMQSVSSLNKRFSFLDFRYLGKTILGRGIPLLSLGNGARRVLYVGTHHGMEWITSMILMRYLNDLCTFFEKDGSVGKTSVRLLLQTHTIMVIPMLNPDGVEYQIHGIKDDNPLFARLQGMNGNNNDFSHWQANARGVDLNHNYNAGFEAYKKLEKENKITNGPTRYSGESPESEPEVAALCNLIRYHKDLRGVLTLHTQGEEIFYQSGGKVPKGASAVARRLSALSGYKLSESEGLASYGGLTDWCVQKMALPSFTMECGKGENPLPASDYFPIYAGIRQALFAFPTLL